MLDNPAVITNTFLTQDTCLALNVYSILAIDFITRIIDIDGEGNE